MAKKKIKKELVKKSIHLAETKNGKKVNKPIIEIPIKRGVKKGIKRGAYKKTETVIKKPIVKNEPINVTNNEIETPQIIETETPILKDKSEDKYNSFFAEYGAPISINDSVTPPDNKTPLETPVIENKEFNFESNAASSNTTATINQSMPIKHNAPQLVNGFMLLALCDFVVPNVIVMIFKMFDDRAAKINISDTKLDADQKASLMESANAAAAYLFQSVNPLFVFFVGMGIMYSSNIQSELSKIPKTIKRRIRKPLDEQVESQLSESDKKEIEQQFKKPKNK